MTPLLWVLVGLVGGLLIGAVLFVWWLHRACGNIW